eukprot:scaffold302822_cov51-Prasinocladus_malaysianus.AAC.1
MRARRRCVVAGSTVIVTDTAIFIDETGSDYMEGADMGGSIQAVWQCSADQRIVARMNHVEPRIWAI